MDRMSNCRGDKLKISKPCSNRFQSQRLVALSALAFRTDNDSQRVLFDDQLLCDVDSLGPLLSFLVCQASSVVRSLHIDSMVNGSNLPSTQLSLRVRRVTLGTRIAIGKILAHRFDDQWFDSHLS